MRLNLAAHLLDAGLTDGRGARVAIRTDQRSLTYADVAQLSSRYAHALAADDVRPEERVIVALPDGPDFVGALFGILRRGAVLVMVNPDAPRELLQYFFEYTRATAAFVSDSHIAAFEDASRTHHVQLYAVGSSGFDARLASLQADYMPFDTFLASLRWASGSSVSREERLWFPRTSLALQGTRNTPAFETPHPRRFTIHTGGKTQR